MAIQTSSNKVTWKFSTFLTYAGWQYKEDDKAKGGQQQASLGETQKAQIVKVAHEVSAFFPFLFLVKTILEKKLSLLL